MTSLPATPPKPRADRARMDLAMGRDKQIRGLGQAVIAIAIDQRTRAHPPHLFGRPGDALVSTPDRLIESPPSIDRHVLARLRLAGFPRESAPVRMVSPVWGGKGRMAITRRMLLASMACVAAAIAARAAPAAEPPLLDFLTRETQWAQAEMLRAFNAWNFSAWEVDSDEEKPARARLARALVLSRELDPADNLAATVNRELERLWGALTRPRTFYFD